MSMFRQARPTSPLHAFARLTWGAMSALSQAWPQRGEAPNVMRGEETQLLGLIHRQLGFDGLVAMPGTHSKWVQMQGGSVSAFYTNLTGELYALLSDQSILAHSIGSAANSVDADHPQFAAGLALGLNDPGGLTGLLFPIRAATLLDDFAPEAAAARLSGLLIGAEIADAKKRFGPGRSDVVLIASDRIEKLYSAGLNAAGMRYRVVDANDAVRTGLFAVASALWSNWIDTR